MLTEGEPNQPTRAKLDESLAMRRSGAKQHRGTAFSVGGAAGNRTETYSQLQVLLILDLRSEKPWRSFLRRPDSTFSLGPAMEVMITARAPSAKSQNPIFIASRKEIS